MKCARCNRRLLYAAVQIGTQAVGPVCAQYMGLAKPQPARITSYRARRQVAAQLEIDFLDGRARPIDAYEFVATNNVAIDGGVSA